MEIVENEEEEEIPNPRFTSESSYCGEGGVLVHGRAVLSTMDRGDLFSPDLEKKLTSVICNICSQISYNFSAWRTHCLTKHTNVPGYTPSLLHSGLSLTSTHFSVTVQTPYLCSRCSRSKYTTLATLAKLGTALHLLDTIIIRSIMLDFFFPVTSVQIS